MKTLFSVAVTISLACMTAGAQSSEQGITKQQAEQILQELRQIRQLLEKQARPAPQEEPPSRAKVSDLSGVPMLGEYHVVIPAAGFDALAGRLLANGFVTGRAAWSKGGCPEGPRVRVTLTIAGSAEAFSPPCPGPEFEKAIAAPIDSVAGRLPWSASLRL